MSVLFICLVFHSLCCIYAPESGPVDERKQTTKDEPQHATIEFALDEDDESTVKEIFITNIEEIQEKLNEGSLKSDSSSQTNRLILPPDTSNNPLLLFAQNFNFDSLNRSSDQTPKTTFSTSGSENLACILQQETEMFYLCPYPSLKQKLQRYFDDDKFADRCLYQTIFQENESKVCETQVKPDIIEVFYSDASQCIHNTRPFQRFYLVGNRFCYPLLKTPQGTQIYKKGINKFVEESSAQSSQFEFSSKNLLAYFICYNIFTKRTIYTIHSIPPTLPRIKSDDYYSLKSLSSESFDITQNRFEAMRRAFQTQYKQKLHLMLPHKLVPKADKLSIFWQQSTSHFSNVAPLWIFVMPMMKLIEHHLRRYARLTSHRLTIQTIVLPLSAEASKLPSKNELLNPSVWIKVVTDYTSKSGIIIIVYSTPFLKPTPNELCEIATQCDFVKWTQIPDEKFDIKMTDDMYDFAYCCETLKTSKPSERRFNGVLDINLKSRELNPSPERVTKRAKHT